MLLSGIIHSRAAAAVGTGLDAVQAGDAAWATGDRRGARAAWRAAAEGEHPAAVAMAELRLLFVSGNLGLAVHGPRADAALARCPAADPWCRLAAADRELLPARLGLPGDRGAAAAQAQAAAGALPEAATARLVMAGAAPRGALGERPADGAAAAVVAGGGDWPRGPGTWVLGLAAAGARGQGLGLGLRAAHPDLGLKGHRAEISATVSTVGAWAARGGLQTSGPAFVELDVEAHEARVLLFPPDGAAPTDLRARGGAARAAGGLRRRGAELWLGPAVRADRGGGVAARGAGGAAGLRVDLRGPWAAAASLGAVAGQGLTFSQARAEVRRSPERGAALQVALIGDLVDGGAPAWWSPTVGGGELLRHGAAGRFRAPAVGAAVAEWRQPLGGPFGAVAFGEAAWADGPHGGLGAGLRIALPPQPVNTLRLDGAWGDGGWGLSVGLGAAF